MSEPVTLHWERVIHKNVRSSSDGSREAKIITRNRRILLGVLWAIVVIVMVAVAIFVK